MNIYDLVKENTKLTMKFDGDENDKDVFDHFRCVGIAEIDDSEGLILIKDSDFLEVKKKYSMKDIVEFEEPILDDEISFETQEIVVDPETPVIVLNYKNLLKFHVGEIDDNHLYFDLTNAGSSSLEFNIL